MGKPTEEEEEMSKRLEYQTRVLKKAGLHTKKALKRYERIMRKAIREAR